MKHIQAFLSTAMCLAALAFATGASAQTVNQGVVTVVRIQGEARYSAGDNIWHPLSVGTTLGAGNVIQSGANSTVDLVLDDKAVKVGYQQGPGAAVGSVINVAGLPKYHTGHQAAVPDQNIIHLQANTILSVDKFTYSQTGVDTVSDTELDLRSGQIFGNVKKISAASQYLVKTPTGVAGIRGTAFLLGSDGSVTVLQGSVVISTTGTNGQVFTTVLSAGEQFDPKTDQVTRINPNELIDAIRNADAIIIAIHSLVTVVETPTLNGLDTTTIYISPTMGRR